MRRNKKLQWISGFLVFALCICTMSVSVTGENPQWERKLDVALKAVLTAVTDEELLTVYVFLEDINRQAVADRLLKEKGFDSEVYKDPSRFNTEIAPAIAQSIVDRVGYEEAYREIPDGGEVVAAADGSSNETFQSFAAMVEAEAQFGRNTLVSQAVSAKVDEFIQAESELIREACTTENELFVSQNVDTEKRRVLYNGKYAKILILEATKVEVKQMATRQEVKQLLLCEDTPQYSLMSTAISQIGADGSTGTKSPSYNGGNGFRGTGVKIGVIEAEGGVFSTTHPFLKSIVNTRLFYVPNPGQNSNNTIDRSSFHANFVTSILVGQSYNTSGITFEGVVPNATVYQMPVWSSSQFLGALDALKEKGVSVINYSGGTDPQAYSSHDAAVDNWLHNNNITLVVAAGNSVSASNAGQSVTNRVSSPGNAYNAITVGAADTINSNFTAKSSPYGMWVPTSSATTGSSFISSSLQVAHKPDLVAPGVNIRCWDSTAGSLKYENGTSLSAPLVTGVIAQMMQANPALKTKSVSVKAKLLLAANYAAVSGGISPYTNYALSDSMLKERSGAGLLDAKQAVTAALETNGCGTYASSVSGYTTSSRSYSGIRVLPGQQIRVAMVYEKAENVLLNDYTDNLDIKFTPAGTETYTYAKSASSRQNVEIFEYINNTGVTIYGDLHIDRVSGTNTAITIYFSAAWQVS